MATLTSHFEIDPPKPRILVSGHLPPPAGGIATYFVALLNSALPQLVDLSFVQTSSQKRTLAASGSFTAKNLVSAIMDCARFTGSLLRTRPRVVHISSAFGFSFLKHSVCVWIARIAGCRVLLHPRCSISILYLNRPKLWQWYFRLVVRQTRGVLALSSEWLQLETIVPSCKVYYLPNAIDQTPYRKIAIERLARPEVDTTIKILYLGYVGKDKGSYDLIEAARILKSAGVNATIDVVGDELKEGDKAALIKKVVAEGLSDTVFIHAPAYGDEKLAFFRQADIFAYPSYHEGLPNAVLEAMACALPIVATRVGGIPDQVVDGVNGILVDPGKPDLLAAGLAKLSHEKTLRNAMRLKSLQFAQDKFDMKTYIPKLVNIYTSLNEG